MQDIEILLNHNIGAREDGPVDQLTHFNLNDEAD
jgi:hypothetical protein